MKAVGTWWLLLLPLAGFGLWTMLASPRELFGIDAPKESRLTVEIRQMAERMAPMYGLTADEVVAEAETAAGDLGQPLRGLREQLPPLDVALHDPSADEMVEALVFEGEPPRRKGEIRMQDEPAAHRHRMTDDRLGEPRAQQQKAQMGLRT